MSSLGSSHVFLRILLYCCPCCCCQRLTNITSPNKASILFLCLFFNRQACDDRHRVHGERITGQLSKSRCPHTHSNTNTCPLEEAHIKEGMPKQFPMLVSYQLQLTPSALSHLGQPFICVLPTYLRVGFHPLAQIYKRVLHVFQTLPYKVRILK